jgi:hypothetical protein
MRLLATQATKTHGTLLPLDELLPTLATAREEFHRGRSSEDGGRKGVSSALNAVLRDVGAASQTLREMLEPLYYLAATLDDLDKGRRDPIHAPKRSEKGGAPPAPSQWWFLKESVAVAVSILLDDTERFHPGWGPREDAANDCVARRLNRIGFDCDSITVGNWRSEVMAHLLPSGTTANERVSTYLEVWHQWQDRKAEIPAMNWVEGLIGDHLRPIAAHPPKKVR